MWRPTIEDVDDILDGLASATGEAPPTFTYLGPQGRALVESALASAFHTFGRKDLHATTFDKAAAMFRSLVSNHGLVDGNKRLAVTLLFTFLEKNEYRLRAKDNDMLRVTLAASSGGLTVPQLSAWIAQHAVATRP